MKILLALASLMFLVGCSASPSVQAYTTEMTVNGLGNQMITLHDTGVLTGDAYEGSAVVINGVAGLFPELEQAAKDAEAAGPLDTIQSHFHFNKIIDQVTDAVNAETKKLLDAKNKK